MTVNKIINKKGFVLIGTLFVMAILAVLGTSFAFSVRAAIKIDSWNMDHTKNYYIARAGIHKTAGIIRNHLNELSDSVTSNWWANNKFYKNVKFAKSKYSIVRDTPLPIFQNTNKPYVNEFWYGLDDEESRLNINVATPEMLQQFDNIDQLTAFNIIAYRDKKSNLVKKISESIKNKNVTGPITNLNELLKVNGITKDILYGDSKNSKGIAQYLTCYSSGKVNINTASAKVLKAIGFNYSEVSSIIAQRQPGWPGFLSINSIFDSISVSADRKSKLQSILVLKSKNYLITCMTTKPKKDVSSYLVIKSRLSVNKDLLEFSLWKTQVKNQDKS